MKPTLLALALTLTAIPGYAVDERRSTSVEQTNLAVTIYNGDLALVKDARKVKLGNGDNLLAWREVSARMQPETALLRTLDGSSLDLLEQNFDFDLLTPSKLLEKSVGQQVRVYRTQPITGTEFIEKATLLSVNDGVVLQFPDRIEGGAPGRIAFSEVPAGLRDRPTLSMLVNTDTPTNRFQLAERDLELSYLTGGLTWKADYVAELSADEKNIALNGWVTLTNTSGTSYPNAQLQLVAGTVNRAAEEARPVPMMVRAMAMADAAPKMQTESLFEYHLYTLGRKTTLADQQTKQVALLSAQKVNIKKEFRLTGGGWYYHSQHGDLGKQLKPAVTLEFDNKASKRKNDADGLGVPLPKGIVRVYKRDSAGRAQFIGEDRIEHTAKGETVQLKLGEAFDVTADKKQTDYQKLATFNTRNGVIESTYELEIRNAKDENVTIRVIEPMPGEWQMLQESHPHSKTDAHTASWSVNVPAGGKSVLTWRVRVKY